MYIVVTGLLGAGARTLEAAQNGNTYINQIEPYRHPEPVAPVPLRINVNPDKVALGKRLFNDRQLSGTGEMACASCHINNRGGADGLPFSTAQDGTLHTRNTPSIYNLGLQPLLHWDGKYNALGYQATTGFKATLKVNWAKTLPYLSQDTEYRTAFRRLYPEGPTPKTVGDAVAAYMKSLTTPNAPFDRYLRGENNAISTQARQGYGFFKSYGCVSCHNGIGIGGNMMARLGHFGNYFEDRGNITQADLGRYNITGREKDRYRFKVPSLRNIALTAPYFHDAGAATLREAVIIVSRYQLGMRIPDNDLEAIIAFLESLTGEQPGDKL